MSEKPHVKCTGCGWQGRRPPNDDGAFGHCPKCMIGTVVRLAEAGSHTPPATMIKLCDVVIGLRKRALTDVEELAESIADVGLMNPITVREDRTLIAGLHRIKACEKLGWEEIPARVLTVDDAKAELAQIDENIRRTPLTELQESQHLQRRKELYAAANPSAKSGSDDKGAVIGFTDDAAKQMGKSTRVIRRKTRRAANIAPDVQKRIASTPIADSGSELDALASAPPEEQREAVARVASGEAETIREAMKPAKRRTAAAPLPVPPAALIDAARATMGNIDLDPSGSEEIDRVVKAAKSMSFATGSLVKPWSGLVWVAPDKTREADVVEKLVESEAQIWEFCLYSRAVTAEKWSQEILARCDAVCFVRRDALDHELKKGARHKPMMVVYRGSKRQAFIASFSRFGVVV